MQPGSIGYQVIVMQLLDILLNTTAMA